MDWHAAVKVPWMQGKRAGFYKQNPNPASTLGKADLRVGYGGGRYIYFQSKPLGF